MLIIINLPRSTDSTFEGSWNLRGLAHAFFLAELLSGLLGGAELYNV